MLAAVCAAVSSQRSAMGARAVAAEEGHDGGPRGLSDDALAIGAVVTQEHE
jgi:hypothetical protein